MVRKNKTKNKQAKHPMHWNLPFDFGPWTHAYQIAIKKAMHYYAFYPFGRQDTNMHKPCHNSSHVAQLWNELLQILQVHKN